MAPERRLTLSFDPLMADNEDNVDRELFRNIEKLRELRIAHRDLDDVIHRLSLDMHIDELQLKRLKKRKLMLKDQITILESQLIPTSTPEGRTAHTRWTTPAADSGISSRSWPPPRC